MNFRVLGGFGSVGVHQRPSAFLVNNRVLIDAGTVPGALTVPEQFAIEHALISHSHLDHTVGLAFLAETLACVEAPSPCQRHEPGAGGGHAAHIGLQQRGLARLRSSSPASTGAQVSELAESREQRVGDLWVTPVAVNHTVPTAGFIVHDGHTGFVYSGDTGPTSALWQAARELAGLGAPSSSNAHSPTAWRSWPRWPST